MRKVKFRGKALGTERYVYGGYYKVGEGKFTNHYILNDKTGNITEVEFGSVEQYIGITDKYRQEIYENSNCLIKIKRYKSNTDRTILRVDEYLGQFRWNDELGPYFSYYDSSLNCLCSMGLFDLYNINYEIEKIDEESNYSSNYDNNNISKMQEAYKMNYSNTFSEEDTLHDNNSETLMTKEDLIKSVEMLNQKIGK